MHVALNHDPSRPKPGINKRPICAAIAGVTAKRRVPDYWGEAVGDIVNASFAPTVVFKPHRW
jgi:hypothetical protein